MLVDATANAMLIWGVRFTRARREWCWWGVGDRETTDCVGLIRGRRERCKLFPISYSLQRYVGFRGDVSNTSLIGYPKQARRWNSLIAQENRTQTVPAITNHEEQ